MVLPVQRSIARLAAAPVCVVTLGSRGTELLPTMCKGSPPPFPPPKTLQLSTKSSQTMKEFWFFNFSSSLICCLRNSILWRRSKAMLILVYARICMCFASAYLCSRSVAWISHTLTKERRFLSSVQFSDKQMLPIVWASSRSLDACVIGTLQTFRWCHEEIHDKQRVFVGRTCFSTCSAGQPCTCLMRFSLKWDEREGVREQEVRAAEVVEGAEAELGALLTLDETWLGPGEGLLWLLW